MPEIRKGPRERILIIDDDVELFDLLERFLNAEGFDLHSSATGRGGIDKAQMDAYSMLILDVMLPDMTGFDVLGRLRSSGITTPVLMLTARGDTQDRILGLEMGADDYLPKPFDPSELAARVRAILRRVHTVIDRSIIVVDEIEVDPGSREARRDGKPISLTTVEFDLLSVLIRAAGTTVSRESLVRMVLGRDFSPFDRSIDTHVYNLRKKLGSFKDGTERIKGIRGTGYLYVNGKSTGRER